MSKERGDSNQSVGQIESTSVDKGTERRELGAEFRQLNETLKPIIDELGGIYLSDVDKADVDQIERLQKRLGELTGRANQILGRQSEIKRRLRDLAAPQE